MEPQCPLCSGNASGFYVDVHRKFLKCSNCLSVFLDKEAYLTEPEEEAHYRTHNNNPEDVRYQKFVSPIVNSILHDFNPNHKGLDFGSGTGSPIMKMLTDAGYDISQYDLFFHNHMHLLQKQYDYIACSETAEHFKEPYKEFSLLRSRLLPGGRLYLMTELYDAGADFSTWYYKKDPTHVFLYHPRAFEWIMNEFEFTGLKIEGRLITLSL